MKCAPLPVVYYLRRHGAKRMCGSQALNLIQLMNKRIFSVSVRSNSTNKQTNKKKNFIGIYSSNIRKAKTNETKRNKNASLQPQSNQYDSCEITIVMVYCVLDIDFGLPFGKCCKCWFSQFDYYCYYYCLEFIHILYSILVRKWKKIHQFGINIHFFFLSFSSFLLLFIICVLFFAHSQMQMVHEQNYPVERHTVQTIDGYLLTMYRIPNMNEQRDNRKVILLMHGK